MLPDLRARRAPTMAALAVWSFTLATACGQVTIPGETPGIDVTVTQLDWMDVQGQVLIPSSRVGRLTFTVTGDRAPFLQAAGGAYVNVVTDAGQGPQWSVQNLLLVFRDEAELNGSRPSVLFELPATGFLDTIDVGVTRSPDPLAAMPDVGVEPQPVQHRGYHVGGRRQGGSELADIPLVIGPWVGPPIVFPIQRISGVQQPVDQIPAVAEDDNGCGPGAVARSLGYMGDVFGLDVGDADVVYLDLFSLMGTSLDTGTDDGDILDGKNGYADFTELPIDSELQGWPAGVGGAMDTLDRGGDVEVLITWDEVDEDDWESFLDELFADEQKQDSALDKAEQEDEDIEELLDELLQEESDADAEVERLLDELEDPPPDPDAREALEEALDEALEGSGEADEELDEFWSELWELMFDDGPGGHVAMVTRIVQLVDGSYLLTYVDDPQQGDGEAANEEITIHVQPDGTFPGGVIDRLLIENLVL